MSYWVVWSAIGMARAEDHVTDSVVLKSRAVVESSGIAASRRLPGFFWTHNDSGDGPNLYAVDTKGRSAGQIRLEIDAANDWEDMASFRQSGVARLVVADCGDNDHKRDTITLHFFDEPDPRKSLVIWRSRIQSVQVEYPDGHHDCEGIGVDVQRNQIVLVTKTLFPACGVYAIPLPERLSPANGRSPKQKPLRVRARRIATLPMPMVTAMDIDETSGDLWIVNYLQAFRFACEQRNMPLAEQISRLPKAYPLPAWRQIESICIDDAKRVWITSEGFPARMGRLQE